MNIDTIYTGDSLDILKTFPDESVNCFVSSPPYFGHRDYGTDKWEGGDPMCEHRVTNRPADNKNKKAIIHGVRPGVNASVCELCGATRVITQIGLEQTPEQYVARLVAVFHEAQRVLRKDGTLFLNIGDSYSMTRETNSIERLMFNTPSNAQRVTAYDTFDKAPEDYQARGCFCGNLCDVCRVVYRRKSHIDNLPVAMLFASLSESTRESMGFANDHLPTWDLVRRVIRIFLSIQDQVRFPYPAVEQLPSSHLSTIDEFSRQLLALYFLRANHGECLLCARSLISCDLVSDHKSDAVSTLLLHKMDSALHGDQQAHHNQYRDRACVYCIENETYSPPNIQPYCTTNLKPKNLLGIPWRVAFALQDDGWILRSDIIWGKKNPMPESVKDRVTKSHEYVFMFAKSGRYYFDWRAIRETAAYDGRKDTKLKKSAKYADPIVPGTSANSMAVKGAERWAKDDAGNYVRNKRSVWMLTSEPSTHAHYAAFPKKLIEPMILAGCPKDGIVLDPFMGSGTTALVARALGRHYVGIDLNPEYVALAQDRLRLPFEPRVKKQEKPIDDLPLFSLLAGD